MEVNAQATLASIVKENHHTVPVLEKYRLDFCCKGKRTLSEACKESNVAIEDVMQELQDAGEDALSLHVPFTDMTAEQLVSYIVTHHHFFVKQAVPVIFQHLQKVAGRHGERFPYMVNVARLFTEVAEELASHMQKEEMILFPRIKQLEAMVSHGDVENEDVRFILSPIGVMEKEHEHAGNLLAAIRRLTNNYSVPADACTTFRITIAELKEFEEDLHRHVHLENNVLFPLAEKLLRSSGARE
jgi:regulator of cell morphogenesis and NO signaling